MLHKNYSLYDQSDVSCNSLGLSVQIPWSGSECLEQCGAVNEPQKVILPQENIQHLILIKHYWTSFSPKRYTWNDPGVDDGANGRLGGGGGEIALPDRSWGWLMDVDTAAATTAAKTAVGQKQQ